MADIVGRITAIDVSSTCTCGNGSPRRPFSTMPDHVLTYLLSFLTPRSACLSCCLVSKRFKCAASNMAVTVIDKLSRHHAWVRDLFADADDVALNTDGSSTSSFSIFLRALHIITSPHVMLVGGNTEPRRVDSYDVVCNRWAELAETVVVREVFFEVLWHAGFCYVFCGIHHASYGTVERFNPVANRWSACTPLPGKLAAVVGAVFNGKVYVIGGYDWHSCQCSDAVFVMDSGGGDGEEEGGVGGGRVVWTQLDCRLRMGRSSHACVAFQGKLWVAGGISDDEDSEGNPTVEVLDPVMGFWVPGPMLSIRRFRCRLFVVCDELYVVGGDRDERGRLIRQSIEKLDASGTAWVPVTHFKVERRGFLSSCVGSKIYILGGRTGEVPLTTWDCFDVSTGRWLSDALLKSDAVGGGDVDDDAAQDTSQQWPSSPAAPYSPKRTKMGWHGHGDGEEHGHGDGEEHWHEHGEMAASSFSLPAADQVIALAAPVAAATTVVPEPQPTQLVGLRRARTLSMTSVNIRSGTVSGEEGEEDGQQGDGEAVAACLATCQEWLLPGWRDSPAAAFSPRLPALLPSVALNRRGGVVGGRAVTVPDHPLTW